MKRCLDVYVRFNQLTDFRTLIDLMAEVVQSTGGDIRWPPAGDQGDVCHLWQLRTAPTLNIMHLRDTLRAMGIEANDFPEGEVEGATWVKGLSPIREIVMPEG